MCPHPHPRTQSPVPFFACLLPLQGEVAFLLATDVAARGLDILGVETVINFDCPTQLASYLHRWVCGQVPKRKFSHSQALPTCLPTHNPADGQQLRPPTR